MFFGTDEFALETLKKLHEREKTCSIERLDVCCNKMKHLVPAVTKYSEVNNLNFHIWPPNIQQDEFDLGVVASFGHLIPSKVISKFPLGMINVHGSLLPKLRGAAPIIYALKDGYTTTGITIMKIKPKKFDVGDILATSELQILPDDTRPQLTHKMAVLGANLLGDVLDDLDRYTTLAVPQSEEGATYAPVVNKSSAFIDFNTQSGEEVYNLWRGVGDLMKLRTSWKSTNTTTRFGVVLPPSVLADLGLDQAYPQAVPGQAVYLKPTKKRNYLCIKCREGWVAVHDIFYGTKKVMQPRDFYNGFLGRRTTKKKCRKSGRSDSLSAGSVTGSVRSDTDTDRSDGRPAGSVTGSVSSDTDTDRSDGTSGSLASQIKSCQGSDEQFLFVKDE